MSRNIKVRIYNPMTLAVALYGSETWWFKLWEVLGDRVLKNTRGPNVEEIVGGLKPAYLGASNFMLLWIENRKTSWMGHITHMERNRNKCSVLAVWRMPSLMFYIPLSRSLKIKILIILYSKFELSLNVSTVMRSSSGFFLIYKDMNLKLTS